MDGSGPGRTTAEELAAYLESRKRTTRITLIIGVVLVGVGLVAGFSIGSGWFLLIAPGLTPWFTRRARERALTNEILGILSNDS